MISRYSSSRTLNDHIVLGSLTSFTAGAVNVASFMLFFSFTSNVTGHYAVLAAEIVKGNFYQIGVVFSWIFLFFMGGFISNFILIHFMNRKRTYLAHALPLIIEIACIASVGIYGQLFYKETLNETEVLLALLIFAMGVQNGFTASISNFAIKTTHLTGITTDLGILFAMFTKKQFRQNRELKGKAKLLLFISSFYIAGAVASGLAQVHLGFRSFYLTCGFLVIVALYDSSRLKEIQKQLAIRSRGKLKAQINTITEINTLTPTGS